MVPEAEVQTESYWAQTSSTGLVPSGGPRGESVPCLFQLLEAAGIPWLVAPSLQSLLLSSDHLSSHQISCIFLFFFFFFLYLPLIRTIVIPFRACPDDPG